MIRCIVYQETMSDVSTQQHYPNPTFIISRVIRQWKGKSHGMPALPAKPKNHTEEVAGVKFIGGTQPHFSKVKNNRETRRPKTRRVAYERPILWKELFLFFC